MKQRCQRSPRNRALERPNMDGVRIRTASVEDAEAIVEIYNQGIEDRVATFETALRICGRSAGLASSHRRSLSRRCCANRWRNHRPGSALDRTGTGNVIGASANFRCTSIAIGEGEASVIC